MKRRPGGWVGVSPAKRGHKCFHGGRGLGEGLTVRGLDHVNGPGHSRCPWLQLYTYLQQMVPLHGNPLQYSCQENSTDRRAWRAVVHGVGHDWATNTHPHLPICLSPLTYQALPILVSSAQKASLSWAGQAIGKQTPEDVAHIMVIREGMWLPREPSRHGQSMWPKQRGDSRRAEAPGAPSLSILRPASAQRSQKVILTEGLSWWSRALQGDVGSAPCLGTKTPQALEQLSPCAITKDLAQCNKDWKQSNKVKKKFFLIKIKKK